MPPATHPLARQYIGYGVVNVSFTHLLNEPGSGGLSRGYLRRGTVVRIIERRQLVNRGSHESWVLVEESRETKASTEAVSPEAASPETRASQGWLNETTVEIFDNESRANTASKAMSL